MAVFSFRLITIDFRLSFFVAAFSTPLSRNASAALFFDSRCLLQRYFMISSPPRWRCHFSSRRVSVFNMSCQFQLSRRGFHSRQPRQFQLFIAFTPSCAFRFSPIFSITDAITASFHFRWFSISAWPRFHFFALSFSFSFADIFIKLTENIIASAFSAYMLSSLKCISLQSQPL